MKRLELAVVEGSLAPRRFSVGEGGLRLGRSSSNDIHIPDEALSRNHCMFEPMGESGVRLTDLASANGTFLNGKRLNGAADLKPGDEIAVGGSVLRVVGADAQEAAAGVDLGLGAGEAAAHAATQQAARRRSPLANVLWGVAVALLVGAIVCVMAGNFGGSSKPRQNAPEEEAERVLEMRYEKVVADSSAIFRYFMSLQRDGTLRVAIDDVPGENRHVDQPKHLDDRARARLDEILLDRDIQSLDRVYVGPDAESPELKSWSLKVVYSTRVKSVRVVNAPEPEAFRRIREKLEAFSKNELGIWAIQCSRAQLEEMAAECARAGDAKWEDRDVEHGNLAAAIGHYREAMAYLDTVNPKPQAYSAYRKSLVLAEGELEARYRDQRFRADRAINLGDWPSARAELKVLCQMIPDRDDDRNREAAAKLLDVEQRMKNGGR